MNHPPNKRVCCIYCGTQNDLSRDHIPPRAIFPDGPAYRHNLITVPACRRCNKKCSLDDEYLAVFLSGHAGVTRNPVSSGLHPRLDRGIKRTRRGSLGKRIRRSLKLVDARTPTGLIVGRQPVMSIDIPILRRVGQRILRGLYFHHFGVPVPERLHVDFVVLADISSRTARDWAEIEPIQRALAEETLYNVGPEVFKYRFRPEGERSLWLMSLYDAIDCFGVIQREPTLLTVAHRYY
jgi:hypothetical protein